MKTGVGEPRGILNHAAGKKKFQHERYQPSPKCSFFIQHFWIVEWDLVTPYVQEVLPHPSVHVVFENNASRIVGVMKGKFTRILLNRGLVFGIKFRPGAFYPFIEYKDVMLIGCEAAGRGIETGQHAATLAKGEKGVFPGMRSSFIQDGEGQIDDDHAERFLLP